MSRNKKIIVFQIILPLILGILIYALFRRQPPFGQYLPWDSPAFDISFLPNFLYIFIVYWLPGMLWTFAFISALNMKLKRALTSAFIVMSVVIVYEYLQYRGIINGVGDVEDIFHSLCAVMIYILFFRRDRR